MCSHSEMKGSSKVGVIRGYGYVHIGALCLQRGVRFLTTRVQRQKESEVRSEWAGDKTRAAENGKRT